jgi:hypothetical protein
MVFPYFNHLTPCHIHSMNSIGSSLQILELDTAVMNTPRLLEALTMQGSQLVTLSLKSAWEMSWQPWIQYLPEIVRLCELAILHERGGTFVDIGQEDFLDALRKNGSLQKVSIVNIKCWGTTEMQRAQLYCDRNRFGVLQEHHMDCNATVSQPFLCPSLWHVIKPAWRVAPRAIFSGLLACHEFFGPSPP